MSESNRLKGRSRESKSGVGVGRTGNFFLLQESDLESESKVFRNRRLSSESESNYFHFRCQSRSRISSGVGVRSQSQESESNRKYDSASFVT